MGTLSREQMPWQRMPGTGTTDAKPSSRATEQTHAGPEKATPGFKDKITGTATDSRSNGSAPRSSQKPSEARTRPHPVGLHRSKAGKPVESLSEALAAVYEAKWSRLSSSDNYLAGSKKLVEYFGPSADPRKLSDLDIEHFTAWLTESYAPSTVNAYLNALSGLLTWMGKHMDDYTAPHVSRPTAPTQKKLETFTDAELSALLHTLTDINQATGQLAYFLAYTGARPIEAFNIRVGDIDTEHGLIRIWSNKTNSERVLPIAAQLEPTINALMEPWKTRHNVEDRKLFSISRDTFMQHWNRARKMLGKEKDTKWVPYTLRHTFATILARNNTDLQTVAKALGHRSLQTTMRYVHLTVNDIRDSFAALPTI